MLNWSTLETDLLNFWRRPILIWGEHEAILVDGGFTFSSGRKQVEQIRATGKKLSKIIVTCHDPDYYFGLKAVTAAYPGVPVVAPPEIASKIAETAAHKVDVWRATLGRDGPQSIADVVLPEATNLMRFDLEGTPIDVIKGKRPGFCALWLPRERAILGGVEICGPGHVWMADAQLPEERAGWLASLDALEALDALDAPPGHFRPGSLTDHLAIQYTRDYILAFEEELPRAADSKALIDAMIARYPKAQNMFVLELGARANKGEQAWP